MVINKIFTAEIFLVNKTASPANWQEFIFSIIKFCHPFESFKIIITNKNHELRFFIITNFPLPPCSDHHGAFLLKSTSSIFSSKQIHHKLFIKTPENLFDLINYTSSKNKGILEKVETNFKKLNNANFITTTSFYLMRNNKQYKHRAHFLSPFDFLALDFSKNKSFAIKSVPKFLITQKVLPYINNTENNSLLSVETFPFLSDDAFLNLENYDFNKHSLVLGSSGSGKSKFLSLFASRLENMQNAKENYRIIIIDPHASLKQDLETANLVDFMSSYINLFNSTGDPTAATELLLNLFKTLLAENYNAKLERVLRHALHLLIVSKTLNFTNLKKLMTELEFRNSLVQKNAKNLPFSVVNFFLTDFTELKTKSYSEAIAPIISFVDEMEILPAFSNNSETTLENIINKNFINIFSLDRTKLGSKITKTLAGLIMEQLMTLAETKSLNQHIIFIIDEVAVVENPILSRLLSEARKFNISIFLSGQFFNQFSDELKHSILTNTINYYLFRISKLDALTFSNALDFKIRGEDDAAEKIKFLTDLNNRECLVRLSAEDKLLPAFKAKTLNINQKEI